MPRKSKPGSARIDLDIAIEAKLRFGAIHDALGFKTKTETFEALVYTASTKDIVNPRAIERIERKLDSITETLDGLA